MTKTPLSHLADVRCVFGVGAETGRGGLEWIPKQRKIWDKNIFSDILSPKIL